MEHTLLGDAQIQIMIQEVHGATQVTLLLVNTGSFVIGRVKIMILVLKMYLENAAILRMELDAG